MKNYVHQIIASIKSDKKKKYQKITQESERKFLTDFFAKHCKAEDKINPEKAKSILFGQNSNYKGKITHCFYLEQDNGVKEEISYLKCLAEIRDQSYFSQKTALKEQYESQGKKLAEFITEILKAFPLSMPQIIQVLTEKFPYKKMKTEQQYTYFKMMLEIAIKQEGAEEQILDICIDKFLQIDADIKVDQKSSILSSTQEIEEKLNVR